MDEAEPPPPHAGERLTREDVLRLIEEHGGPEGLDLRGADLSQADLNGLGLYGIRLSHADLQGADLCDANLEAAKLVRSDLREAYLACADLQGARLGWADLRRARLDMASLRDADLENANWGDYILGWEAAGEFLQETPVYRALKQRHTEAGMYDIAGEFFYREMEARRKLAWKERRLPYALSMYALRFLYGYGERPVRVIGWVVAVVFGLAFVYLLPGVLTGGFRDALYYSAVSFTALGYGGWAPHPQGWAGRFLGVGESLMGVFMMALFLVTFTRKMTR